MATTELRLRPLLIERYPDRELPFGTQIQLALELGVTRQRIEQLVSQLGWRTLPRDRQPSPECYKCMCGRVRRNPKPCADCLRVTLPCERCGRPVTRLISALLIAATNRGGHVYCSSRCACEAMWPTALAGTSAKSRTRHSDLDAALQARAVNGILGYGVMARASREFGVRKDAVARRAEALGIGKAWRAWSEGSRASIQDAIDVRALFAG